MNPSIFISLFVAAMLLCGMQCEKEKVPPKGKYAYVDYQPWYADAFVVVSADSVMLLNNMQSQLATYDSLFHLREMSWPAALKLPVRFDTIEFDGISRFTAKNDRIGHKYYGFNQSGDSKMIDGSTFLSLTYDSLVYGTVQLECAESSFQVFKTESCLSIIKRNEQIPISDLQLHLGETDANANTVAIDAIEQYQLAAGDTIFIKHFFVMYSK